MSKQSITLTETETATWHEGGEAADKLSKDVASRARALAAELGRPVEVYDAEGVQLRQYGEGALDG